MSSTTAPIDQTRQPFLAATDPRLAAAGFVLVLAHAPLLFLHVRSLAEWSDYQFFPYAIFAALFLVIMAVKGSANDAPARPRPALCYALLTLSWAMLAFGLFVISSPRAGALALISTSAAILLAYGRTSLLRRLLPAYAIFCMIIPLPWNLDQVVVSALQSLTARESGYLLDSLNIPNIVQAHCVKLPSTILQVEEGCSGINSLFTILITSILYVCYMKRPLFRSLLLLVAAVAAMLLGNILRVVAVGVLAERYHLDWSKGWRHEVLGLIFFGMALILVGSMDQFLFWASTIFPRIRVRLHGVRSRLRRWLPKRKRSAPIQAPAVPPPAVAPACFSLPVAVAFGLLVLAQTAWLVPTKFNAQSDSVLIDRAQNLAFDRLSESYTKWDKQGTDKSVRDKSSPFGRFSTLTGFNAGELTTSLELDYPFFGWHNLTNCYALRGWDVKTTTIRATHLPGQQPGDTVEQMLSRGVDEQAILLYSLHDSGGRILRRPGKGPDKRWLQAHLLSPRGLNVHLCSLFGVDVGENQVYSAEPEWAMPTLQMQIRVQSLRPIGPESIDLARRYFDSAREVLLRELSGPQEKQP